MTATTGKASLALDFELPTAANDNEPGEWTLPALQRARRGKLMFDDEGNRKAAITLSKVYRILGNGSEPEEVEPRPLIVHNGRYVEAPRPDVNPDGSPAPMERRLRDTIASSKLADLTEDDMRVRWDNKRVANVEVLIDGEWIPYIDWFGEVKDAVERAPYAAKPAEFQVERRELTNLDREDRDLFRRLVAPEWLDVLQMTADSATMEDIGNAAGFMQKKQAEAVGKDRVRSAIRAAEAAFANIERANRQEFWWQGLGEEDTEFGRVLARRAAERQSKAAYDLATARCTRKRSPTAIV